MARMKKFSRKHPYVKIPYGCALSRHSRQTRAFATHLSLDIDELPEAVDEMLNSELCVGIGKYSLAVSEVQYYAIHILIACSKT